MIEVIFSGLGGTIIGALLVFACDRYRQLKEDHKCWCKELIKKYNDSPDDVKNEFVKSGMIAKAWKGTMWEKAVINFDNTTWYKSWWQMIKCLFKPF